MIIDFVDLIGKKIEVEISGGSFHKGILLDSGLDIIVIYDGKTKISSTFHLFIFKD